MRSAHKSKVRQKNKDRSSRYILWKRSVRVPWYFSELLRGRHYSRATGGGTSGAVSVLILVHLVIMLYSSSSTFLLVNITITTGNKDDVLVN